MPGIQRETLLAAGAVVVLLFLLAFALQKTPLGARPSPAPAAVRIVSQNFSVDGIMVGLSQEKNVGNGWREIVNLSNDGSKSTEIGLINLVPKTLSANASFSNPFPETSILPSLTEFLSLNPLIRLVGLTLAPKQTFSTAFSSSASSESPPVHLLSEPRLTQEKKQKLLPLLKKIIDLNLDEKEAQVFQQKFNEAFARAQEQKNSFDEFIDAANAFVEEVKEAKRTKIINPDYNYSIENYSIKLPTLSPRVFNAGELFPELPERIELTASEAYPEASTVTTLKAKQPLGGLLTKFAGELSGFGSAEVTGISEKEYEVKVRVDFADVELENGLYPFDEKKDELILMFGGLPGVSKSIPVLVKIDHVNLNDLYRLYQEKTRDEVVEEAAVTEELVSEYKTRAAANTLPKIVVESVNEEKISSGFLCPVAGPITSQYGNRIHPIDKVRKMHWGIDIGAACGTSIKAPANGVVKKLGPAGGCGNSLSIDHGIDAGGRKIETQYCHIQENGFKVKAGDRVTQGQVIALVGSTGKSTGCHLHFEVKVNGNSENPKKIVPGCGIA